MLTVRNLPRKPTFRGWLYSNFQLLAVLLTWSAAMLWLAAQSLPETHSAWYRLSIAEGGLFFQDMPDEEACKASVRIEPAVCLSEVAEGVGHP